jgi:uncharacterized protein involved in exopolysaccharide biosynthesis
MKRVEESRGAYESLPEVISNALIQNLKAERIRLETSLAELSGKFGTQHPQYVRVQSELETIRAKLAAEINNIIDAIKQDRDSAIERVKTLEAAVAKSKHETLKQNVARYEMDSLSRESGSYSQVYDAILKKFNESALQSDINRTNVFIIDSAVPPSEKSSPKPLLNLVLAIFTGLFLGIGLAFFFDYLDDRIKSGEMLERHSGIPLLGTVTSTRKI